MRAIAKGVLVILIGLTLMAVSLWLYVFRLGGAEKIVNRQMESLLRARHNLHVTVGSISGDLLSGLVLENVSISYVDSGVTYRMAELPRVATAYSLSNLWHRQYLLDYLVVDSPSVTLVQDSTGRWLVPSFSSEGAADTGSLPSFSVDDLKISGADLTLLRAADTFQLRNVSLSGAVAGGDRTYAVEVRRLEVQKMGDPKVAVAAAGRATYSEGLVVFRDVHVVFNGTRLELDGSVRLKDLFQGQVDFDINNADVSFLSRFVDLSLTGIIDVNGTVTFDRDSIRGTATLAGGFEFLLFENLYTNFAFADNRLRLDTLYGTVFNNCTIDGSGLMDLTSEEEEYHLSALIRNFNLTEMLPDAFESDLTGYLELDGRSFRNDRLRLSLRTKLHDSYFDGYSLHSAAGEMFITADSIVFADSFRVEYFENVFYAAGRIDYSGDIDLGVAADLANLSHFRGQSFIERPGGRAHLDARLFGRTKDPSVRATLISDSMWIYDLYAVEFAASVDVARFLTAREGTVEMRCNRGSAWDQPYDSAYVALSVDADLVYIDTATIFGRPARIAGAGVLDYGTRPSQLTIDSLTVTLFDLTFHNDGPMLLAVDSLGFDLQRTRIVNAVARLDATGRINYDESMDLRLSVRQVPLDPWLHLFDTALSLTGNVSCAATVQGTFMEPTFTFLGTVDSITYRDLYLGRLIAGVQYAGRRLLLDSLTVHSPEGTYRTSGSIHADLAFASGIVNRFPDLPLSIRMTAMDRRFDLVSLIMPSVEQLDGDFFADITLSGTPHEPHLEGEAFIRRARLKYFDLENPIFADSAGVTMQDNRIVIDRIDAYVTDKRHGGRRREAYLEGEVVVKSLDTLYYDIDVILPKEFSFSYELDDIRGVVEGELHIIGDSPPLVTGDLTVVSMMYLVNFSTDEQMSPIMQTLSGENTWDLNINIDVLANYWIKNEDIDAEFSGSVNLIREQGVYRFIGDMEILRGRGFLFDKTFRLEPGSRVIFEGDPSINPRLDITGYTRIAGVRSAAGDPFETAESLELAIHVTGTLEVPEINPAPGSEFSKEDILPLLVANYYSSETTASSGLVGQRLSGFVSSQLSQIGTRRLGQLGVETFEIDPIYGEQYDPLRARVTVGAYAAPNLYIYGRSTLSGPARQEVGFEYRIVRGILLEGLRDELELYHLALKLHWEF